MSDSIYLKQSKLLDCRNELVLSDTVCVRKYANGEADKLANTITKRNVFTRHSWEQDFYVQRARELAGQTVISVRLPGDPATIVEKANEVATLTERLLVLAETLGTDRRGLQRRLGVGTTQVSERYLAFSDDFAYLKSQERLVPEIKGVEINDRFQSRLSRCKFEPLFNWLVSGVGQIRARVDRSLTWLMDSLLDYRFDASFVKAAISLESLLVLSENESLASTLCERSAFLLSNKMDERQKICWAIKDFYDARSGIVHGGSKKAKKATPKLLYGVTKLIVLLWLRLGNESFQFTNDQELREWCNGQRWGFPFDDNKTRLPKIYLQNALQQCQKQ